MKPAGTSVREPPIPRDMRFDLSGVPRFWHGGRRSVTLFFDALSLFFPAGERFFLATVKHFRPQLKDAHLLREVDAFCAQEGHHSREHVRYNQMLKGRGYPVDAWESRVEWILGQVRKRMSPKRQLAVTCALEHFTAVMAVLVLKEPRTLEGADPRLAELWRWHAAEEHEHKAVAFDVYQAVGGNYRARCIVMFILTLSFSLRVFEHQCRLMHQEGILFSPREWWALARFLFLRRGALPSLLGPYLSYYRPSFHPWEDDSSDLVERWKAGLPAGAASPK